MYITLLVEIDSLSLLSGFWGFLREIAAREKKIIKFFFGEFKLKFWRVKRSRIKFDICFMSNRYDKNIGADKKTELSRIELIDR